MCVPIPPFAPESGLLPPGEHEAVWDEVQARFGWNARGRQLLDGLADGMSLLGAAGCARVWLNGSFVTAKEEPGDFDCAGHGQALIVPCLRSGARSCST